ncbi:hypothetical protein [Micromonospora sp. URMC 103]|uniref:hypothetical protein n=1 Tax=Micromonospora sp. URMC 103 TaxID=3423406 RepID=UPI003F1CE880
MQIDILRTFARLSGGKRPVNSEQIANALKISTNSAALSNGFFVESGWLARVGRGQYVATEQAVAYNRRMEFGAPAAAVELLAEPARSAWYWQALEPALTGSRLSKNEVLVILADEANTIEEHRPQLENILQWLQFLNLIRTDGEYLVATEAAPDADESEPAQADVEGDTDLNPKHGQGSPDKPDERRAASSRMNGSGDVVIAFSTDLRLTGEDLAALSPDQIRALFEAVGTVASLTKRQ